jgi:hypothetical protein
LSVFDLSGQYAGGEKRMYTAHDPIILGFGCIVSLAFVILGIVIFWKIFSKAGYSGAMSLLLFIPIANLIVLCILAFGKWPIYEELEMLRQRAGYPPQQGYPPYR